MVVVVAAAAADEIVAAVIAHDHVVDVHAVAASDPGGQFASAAPTASAPGKAWSSCEVSVFGTGGQGLKTEPRDRQRIVCGRHRIRSTWSLARAFVGTGRFFRRRFEAISVELGGQKKRGWDGRQPVVR